MALILSTGSTDGLVLVAGELLAGAGHRVTLHARNEQRAVGRDVVGVVERAASDSSGSGVGARVAALVDQSGWAERVALVDQSGWAEHVALVELTPFGLRQFAPGHEGARIQTFMSHASARGFGPDIAALVALLSAGQLDAGVALTVPWAHVAVALDGPRERRIKGKAVFSVSEPGIAALPPGGGGTTQ
jgi:NADPH:quinone reductase-like Zn-dependent oxidoreductase